MQPPYPNPNYPLQNHTDPNHIYYQQSHTSYYNYYYPNQPQPQPQPPFVSDASVPTHDPYYGVAPGNYTLNPPVSDPAAYPSQSYGYEYPVQQPGGVIYREYQEVSVEAMAVPYYSNPNSVSVSHDVAVNEGIASANGVIQPPNWMHQYAPAQPNYVPVTNRPSNLKSTWKKPLKTKVVQSAWCEVCRVCCDTKDVLDKHKAGKKHLKNLEKIQGVSAPSSVPVPVATAGPAHPIIGPPENPNNKKATQLAIRCEVCDISCDTVDVLNVHNMGKKHKKNLEKLSKTSLPVPAPVALAASQNPVVGFPVNHSTSASASRVNSKKKASGSLGDLETKRRKVLDGGAAVSTVRTCVTCNVICNSDTVFQHHIQGQKHLAMMKKIGSGGTNIAAGAM